MLPGARAGSSGDRTRLDRTSCPGPSMMMPNGFARRRIPGETGSQRAASRRVLERTGASRTQSGNDVRTTSPRLRGELRLTLDTLSHIRLCSSHLWRSIHCAGACNFFLDAAASDWGNRAHRNRISGCNKFDAKPIEFESLVAAIRRLVANPN
jgi:hypothetical protein